MAVTVLANGQNSVVSDVILGATLNFGSTNHRLVTISLCGFDFDGTNPSLVSIDAGGVTPTLLSDNSSGTANLNKIYYVTSPPSGTNTVTIEFSDLFTFSMIVTAWAGVRSSSPFSTVQTANASSTTPACAAISPVSVHDAVIDCLSVVGVSGITITADATGTTSTIQRTMAADGTHNYYGVGSRCTNVPGGSCTRSYVLSGSRAWRMQSVAIYEQQYGATITGRP